jgi:hypothetical protein
MNSRFFAFHLLLAWLGASLVALAGVVPANPWEVKPSSGGAPFWQYNPPGTNIGKVGWATVKEPGSATRLFTTAKPSIIGNDIAGTYTDMWYVLGYDRASGGYLPVYSHPPYRATNPPDWTYTIRGLQTANVLGGPEAELIVGLDGGLFYFYSTSTYEELGSVSTSAMEAFRAADLDGDGVAELILTYGYDLKVYNRAGELLWSVAGPRSDDIVVAQMDDDPGMEIATTSGHVIDAATHTIQWYAGQDFGANLRAVDIDDDNRFELIASRWQLIRAFDVDSQSIKWSYPTANDITAIEVGNVDEDPQPELLYGDGQTGGVHVLSLNAQTPQEEWQVPNPDSGISRIVVADTDDDGVVELLWAGGFGGGGQDRLNVVSTVTRQLEWQSVHLDGPYLSPVVGDITGDGIPELVTASLKSEAGYKNGRILVFDAATVSLLGVSDPVGDAPPLRGLHDVKLCDVDHDGRHEIVVGTSDFLNGIIEIYRFTDTRTFERIWMNPNRPVNEPFTQVAVLDVDDDGDLEVVAGNQIGIYLFNPVNRLRVIDYATKTEEWNSGDLGGSWKGIIAMSVANVDSDSAMEAITVLDNGGVYVFDLKSKQLEFFFYGSPFGSFTSVAPRVGQTGFYLGGADGWVRRFTFTEGTYQADLVWQVSDQPVVGLTNRDDLLWVSTGRRIYCWQDDLAPIWASADLGSEVSGPVGFLTTAEGHEAYVGSRLFISGFQPGSGTDPTFMDIEASGSLSEAAQSEATLRFVRSKPSSAPMEVFFTFAGSGDPTDDFGVVGATRLTGGKWRAEIPAHQSSATVTLSAIQDSLPEGSEVVHVEVQATDDYFLGRVSDAELPVVDDEPTVSIIASDPAGSELHTKQAPAMAEFTLRRTGDLTRALTVPHQWAGTATAAKDFTVTPSKLKFPAGVSALIVKVQPKLDKIAEPTESATLTLLPVAGGFFSEGSSSATVMIEDGQPHVSITGTTSVPDGVAVNVARAGGHLKSLTVPLSLIYRHANGQHETLQRRIKFRPWEETAQLVVKPSRKATGSSQVMVNMSYSAEFHYDNSSSIHFTLHPRSSLK